MCLKAKLNRSMKANETKIEDFLSANKIQFQTWIVMESLTGSLQALTILKFEDELTIKYAKNQIKSYNYFLN